MNKSHAILKKFVSEKSKFFQLSDGEETVVKFLFAEAVTTNCYGKPVDSIRYHLEINGKEMFWDRTHRELAQQMSRFSEGDSILIKRHGDKNQTKYVVKKNEE